MNKKEFSTKILNGYSKIHELKLVSIGLASPEKIQSWAEKELPNGKIFGEVTNPNTFHYKTFKPSKGGLFCERIFGPIKDFECACGKRHKPNSLETKRILQHEQTTRFFCPVCDVEYTWSIIRRYQLGYIKLHTPVAHLWYFKTNPSYLSVFFDMRKKDLESIIYCTNGMTIENIWKANLQELNFQRSPTDLYQTWQKFFNFEEKKKQYKVVRQHDHNEEKSQRRIFRNSFFQIQSAEQNKKFLQSIWTQPNERKKKANFFNTLEESSIIFSPEEKQADQFHFLESEETWQQRTNFLLNSQSFKSFNLENSGNQENFLYPFLFSSQKKFFVLLKKQKRKQLGSISFENEFKKHLQKNFKTAAASLFAKNLFEIQPCFFFSQEKFLNETFENNIKEQSTQFLNIFLFFKDTKYLKNVFQLNSNSEDRQLDIKQKSQRIFHKSIFWFSLFSYFHLQKQKKIANLKKLSKKELLFLINFIPIIQKLELYSQERLLKFSLLKFFFQCEPKKKDSFSFGPKSIFLPIPSKTLKKNQTQQSQTAFPLLFTKQNEFFSTSNEENTIFTNKSSLQLQKFLKKFDGEKKSLFQKEKKLLKFSLKFKKIFSLYLMSQKMEFFYFFESEKKFSTMIFQNLFFEYFFVFFVTKNFFSKDFFHFQKKKDFFENFQNQNHFLFSQHLFLSFFQNFSLKDLNFLFSEKSALGGSYLLQKRNQKKTGEFKVENPAYGLRKKIQEKKIRMANTFLSKAQQTFLLFKSFEKNQKVLKNPVVVFSYNSIWENDSDWKYFLYYYSFFFSDFQDLPIFAYRTIFPVFLHNSQKFLYQPSSSFSLGSDSTFSNFGNAIVQPKSFFGGAGIFEKCLGDYSMEEIKKMIKQHQILLPKLTQTIQFLKQSSHKKKDIAKLQKYFQKREHIIRRLKLLRKFFRNQSNPNYFLLKNLPVLPPDLRPILKLENQIAASDLNRFYQRILYRNDRIKKFSKDSATNQSFEMRYAQRLLQEAVDNLIQNGKGAGKPETNSRGQPLKSLSEILKGKQGRFRQYLLGKRVDYSGRSVIVVGPKLKVYECGIPQEMALELFLPFLIQKILQLKLAQTVIGAKNLLKNDSTLALHFLQKILKNIPVLLNRAPTLHKLGFQAFLPKLVEGRAILLHPMVCPGFNADFDGDQMAVHIPLTVEARTEAWKFMLSFNNFINSATGEPNLLPSQDMVLGSYYLTVDYLKKFSTLSLADVSTKFAFENNESKIFLVFQNFHEVFTAYQNKKVFLHTPVWIKVSLDVNFGNDLFKPREFRFTKFGQIQKIYGKSILFENSKNQLVSRFIRTTVGRILMNFMIQECIAS